MCRLIATCRILAAGLFAVATMTLATFARAARGEARDTTIWARFVQPSALAWARDEASAARRMPGPP